MGRPRIAKHLPRFQAAPVSQWARLLADSSGDRVDQINVQAGEDGFGTVCASLVRLAHGSAAHGSVTEHMFAAGPPDIAEFRLISWNA